MAAGDRIKNPDYVGYSDAEITNETPANGVNGQFARLVKVVDDTGANVSFGALPTGAATEAKQDTGNTSLATIATGVGAPADAEASGNGSVIAVLKRLRTLLSGGLPAALSAGGGVKAGLVDALPAGTNNIGDVDVLTQPGAPNIATGQVTAGAVSGQVIAARATRRSGLIRNTDDADSAYVGPSGVSSATGFLLKAGEAVAIDSTAAIHAVRDTNDVVLSYIESYD